jgi:hypothetical protein
MRIMALKVSLMSTERAAGPAKMNVKRRGWLRNW